MDAMTPPMTKIMLVGGSRHDYHTNRTTYVYDINYGMLKRLTNQLMSVRYAFTYGEEHLTALANGSLMISTGRAAAILSPEKILEMEKNYTEAGLRVDTGGEHYVHFHAYMCSVGLYDGSAVVFGAYHSIGKSDIANVRYDTDSKTWTIMSKVRVDYYALCIVLENGDVLVAGGEKNCSANRECRIFDVRTRRFKKTGDMKVTRIHCSGCLIPGGFVFVCGGRGLASCELYNTLTGEWTETRSMIWTRHSHTCVLINNDHVLIIGGVGINEQQELVYRQQTEFYELKKGGQS
jgi:hypothetical protein